MQHFSHLICNAVRFGVAAAILAGCGASAQSLNPVSRTPPSVARALDEPTTGGLERLHARRVHISCNRSSASYTECSFGTRGRAKARGPYPGTFAASGGWESGLNTGHSFVETFTIHSGSSRVTGQISFHTFSGPGGPLGTYQYTSSVGNGTVQVTALAGNNFREVFQGL
jgi:hypothetical protein